MVAPFPSLFRLTIFARKCLVQRFNNDDASLQVLLLWMVGNVFPRYMNYLLKAVPFWWAKDRVLSTHAMRDCSTENPRCESVHPSDAVASFVKLEWRLRSRLFVNRCTNLKK